VFSLFATTIPKTIREALDHPKWRQAIMIDEMWTLSCNDMWEIIILLPFGKKTIS